MSSTIEVIKDKKLLDFVQKTSGEERMMVLIIPDTDASASAEYESSSCSLVFKDQSSANDIYEKILKIKSYFEKIGLGSIQFVGNQKNKDKDKDWDVGILVQLNPSQLRNIINFLNIKKVLTYNDCL